MSAHSSSGRPFKSFNEYRLLTTFLALIPSCCDLRRGETAGEPTLLIPTFLPTVALINLCLSNGEPESCKSSLKNNYARRIATQGFILEWFMDTPVGSFEALKPDWSGAPGGGRCTS
jgi:hypothetical protein